VARGRLRIYLGAAPGVGKTYAMLNEGNRRHERGTDVVVGVCETHGRQHTAAQIGDLEVFPRREVTYRGKTFEEMDLEGLLARQPEVVLVDELAHTNVPGVEHEKRWEDVEALLDAGIDVISTLNLQHLESVNDVVETITGVTQREKVPDDVVRRADQVELVDMTPEALRRRLAHGNVYPAERIDAAMSHFFRPGNLAALRELALLWLADRVDDELNEYRERHGIEMPWETKERVVVSVTGATGADRLIRRAARMARRSKAELVGVTVRSDEMLRPDSEQALATNVALLEELGGRYVEVIGSDVAAALVSAARAENATQLVLGATRRSWREELLRGSIVTRCVRAARGQIDVHVIGSELTDDVAAPRRSRTMHFTPLSWRRVVAALVLGLVAFPIVTALLLIDATSGTLPLAMSAYLLVIIGVASLGGLIPGLVAGATAFLLSNWYFAPPVHTFTIADTRDVLALVSFMVVAVTVSTLVDHAARRSRVALRAERDARSLARVASHITAGERALEEMVDDVVRIFDLEGAAIRRVEDGRSVDVVSVGVVSAKPSVVALDDDHVLAYSGRGLDPESIELLRGIATQLIVALEREELSQVAAERRALLEVDELRSALLAAVSHDLRTPLASIKAAATALLSSSAAFTPEQSQSLLRSIDAETDRLDGLVEDLLDMSRVNEGTIELAIEESDLVELVDVAAEDACRAAGVERDEVTRKQTAPISINTDPTLVSRILYNLILNGLVHGGGSVRVEIGEVAGSATVRVVDHGPGVSAKDRRELFTAFQRSGDIADGKGVGLGLAIAQGFTEILGGELAIEETPGGGCTAVLELRFDAGSDFVG
jgi:two-component system sensor histidine kinase KdpD